MMRASQVELVLLAATDVEAAPVASAMKSASEARAVGKRIRHGRLAGARCRLVQTGIGMTNTAQALTREIESSVPAVVVQFGIAGAYVPADLAIGCVALASEEIYGDVGVLTPTGWRPADEIGLPLVPGDPPRFNRFPLDPRLVNRAATIARSRIGPFVTVSQCTGVRSVGDDLHARFGALCESMEGAAAAHVCALYDVPFLEVRAVSNLVEDRDRSRWQIDNAVVAAGKAVIEIVAEIDFLLQEAKS